MGDAGQRSQGSCGSPSTIALCPSGVFGNTSSLADNAKLQLAVSFTLKTTLRTSDATCRSSSLLTAKPGMLQTLQHSEAVFLKAWHP